MGKGKMAVVLGAFYGLMVGSSLGAVSDEYAFQTSEFMRSTQYRAPDAMDIASADGAYSAPNIAWDEGGRVGTDWFIDEQHWADDVVCAGIAQNDVNAIQRGLLMFAWGFAQQQPDGSFLCTDQFHATAFFVEGVSHACLMLEKSPFARTYGQQIKTLKAQVLKSARWMNEPSVAAAAAITDAPFTHRRYLNGAALGETGVLCNVSDLIRAAAAYIATGESQQWSNGVNPEKGGWDSSYQALGLKYAARYYFVVAQSQALSAMGINGENWETTMILPSGAVSVVGNTRTGSCQERDHLGNCKGVSYDSVYESFYQWYLISGDANYETLASKIFNYFLANVAS
ncbi:MAG: hypothetical protein JOZ08_16880 [Verrucomicrobia bacterium]|nr:hypothetical protein [Verrucomicrobiota bacterium]